MKMKQFKYYWEDFNAGERQQLGSFSLSKEEIIEFAAKYDPQPFHLDDEAAKDSLFGGLVASGWHTCCMTMRLMVDSYLGEAASLGAPGLDELRWLRPVRPDTKLTAHRVCLETRPSKSRADVGLVKHRFEVVDEAGELVMTMVGMGMFRRRQPAQAS